MYKKNNYLVKPLKYKKIDLLIHLYALIISFSLLKQNLKKKKQILVKHTRDTKTLRYV